MTDLIRDNFRHIVLGVVCLALAGGACSAPSIIQSVKTPIEKIVEVENVVVVEKIQVQDRIVGDGVGYNEHTFHGDIIDCDQRIADIIGNRRDEETGHPTAVYFSDDISQADKKLHINASRRNAVLWLMDITPAYGCHALSPQTMYILDVMRAE